MHIKGRFLEFRMYHNFDNLFNKLSKRTFNKKRVSFSKRYRVKSIRLAIMQGIPQLSCARQLALFLF